MLGKRKSTMRRTSSVSLIGSGSVNGDSSPLPEHPKEKQKSSNYPSPCASSSSTPRQVIGFHPKVFIDEELDLSSAAPISPHRSSKSPSGSPRSGLGDLLAGSRPWERKDEGVGLGIVATLSSSQEEVSTVREDGRGYGCRKAPTPHAPGHMPSTFAPAQASPPIPLDRPLLHSNSGRHSPSHCTDRNCCPEVLFGLAPSSFRQESLFLEGRSTAHQVTPAPGGRGGAGGPTANPNSGPWTRANGHSGLVAVNWSHNDMDVDRNELNTIVAPHPHLSRQIATSSGFVQNFLDACHLCNRRLGKGRDIYMYRGDKAFCSPECRHQQILNDECPEKCSTAVMKVAGGSDTRHPAQRTRVMAAGTATAAAA